MPIYAEESIQLYPVFMSMGETRFLSRTDPRYLDEVLHPKYVTVRASTQPLSGESEIMEQFNGSCTSTFAPIAARCFAFAQMICSYTHRPDR